MNGQTMKLSKRMVALLLTLAMLMPSFGDLAGEGRLPSAARAEAAQSLLSDETDPAGDEEEPVGSRKKASVKDAKSGAETVAAVDAQAPAAETAQSGSEPAAAAEAQAPAVEAVVESAQGSSEPDAAAEAQAPAEQAAVEPAQGSSEPAAAANAQPAETEAAAEPVQGSSEPAAAADAQAPAAESAQGGSKPAAETGSQVVTTESVRSSTEPAAETAAQVVTTESARSSTEPAAETAVQVVTTESARSSSEAADEPEDQAPAAEPAESDSEPTGEPEDQAPAAEPAESESEPAGEQEEQAPASEPAESISEPAAETETAAEPAEDDSAAITETAEQEQPAETAGEPAEDVSGEPAVTEEQEEAAEPAEGDSEPAAETAAEEQPAEAAAAPAEEAPGAEEKQNEEQAGAESGEQAEEPVEAVPDLPAPKGLNAVTLQTLADENNAEEEEAVPTEAVETLPVSAALLGAPNDGADGEEGGEEDGEDEGDKTPSIPSLQKMINEAIYGQSELSGRIRVILAKNTVYEGDIDINASRKTVKDDFELEMVAEDAVTNETAGNGYTTISGNITIRGIRVVMNSVSVDAAKKIRVQNAGDMAGEDQASRGGELVYNGSIKFNNTLNLEVGNNSSAEVILGATNDKVNVMMESGAKSLTLDAGDGANNVDVTVAGGDAEIRTGSGMDTMKLTDTGDFDRIHADSGAGIDEVTIIHDGVSGLADLYVTTGEGDDNLTVDLRENAGNITIDTGLGGDNVTVSKGNRHTVESVDYNINHNPYERIRDDAATSTVTFVNSDPDAFDHFVIDVNAAGAVSKIAFEGGKGASVHLKGTLATDPAPGTGNHKPIWRDKNGDIVLNAMVWDSAEVDRTLTLHTEEGPAYNLTDKLINKRSVYLYAMGSNVTQDKKGNQIFNYDKATDEFTNYVLRTPVNDLYKINITGSSRPLTLSNVVIDTKETLDYYVGDDAPDGDFGYLKVPNIEAGMLNVLLKGRTIQIKQGVTVHGQNVRLESAEGTKTAGQAFSNLTRSGEGYESILSSIMDTAAGLGHTVKDLMTIYYKARLNIDGTIKAEHDIDLQARSKLFGNILGLWPDAVNFLNVKVGLAEIEIGKNARLTAEDNITAESKVETSVGMTYTYDDKSGAGTLDKSGPFAQISAVYNSASVDVRNGAELNAKKGDVLLRSGSKATAGEYAHAGALSVPAAIALGFVINNASTEVNGKVTAGRKAELKAVGKVTGEAETIKDGTLGSSGYFVAGNIVYQDVNAIAHEKANITGGRDVRIESRADADVRTLANSAGIQEAPSAKATAIGDFFSALVPVLITQIKAIVSDHVHLDNAEKALKAVFDKGYEVKAIHFSEEDEKKGTVSVSTRDGKSILGNDQTLIVVTPDPAEGYEVDRVYYRYLEPGQDHYQYYKVTKKDGAGNYVFVPQPSENFPPDRYEVIVTFKKTEAPKEEPEVHGIKEHEDDLDEEELARFNAENLEAIRKLDELLKNPLLGLDDDEEKQDQGPGQDEEEDAHFWDEKEKEAKDYCHLVFDPEMKGGKVVTWLVDPKTGRSLSRIYPKQTVRLVPNPSVSTAGLKMQLKTMNVTFETNEGLTETINITPDSRGNYRFTVPENAKLDCNFMVQAEFTQTAADAAEPDHKQTSGAIAIGVVQNHSNALIEDGSTVKGMNGDVELLGLKTTKSVVSADGTGVTEANGKKTEEKDEENVRLEPGDPEYQVGNALYAIEMTTNVTGAVKGTTDRGEGGSILGPKFTITPPVGAYLSKTRIRLTYYSKWDFNLFGGTLTSQDFDGSDFTSNGDGTYTFKPNLNAETIRNGQVMNMSITFVDADGNALENQGGGTEWLVRNPIATVVNELRQKDEHGKFVHYSDSSVGKLLFYGLENIDVTEKINDGRTEQDLKDGTNSGQESTETRTVTHTIYKFKVEKEENYKGYSVDESYDANHKSNAEALYACWYDGGELIKAPLTHKDGYWYFDPADKNYHVPAGVEITVVANFTEDLRNIKTEKQKDDEGKPLDYGTVSVDRKEAKYGDRLTVTLKGKEGYYPKSLWVSYVGVNGIMEYPVAVVQDASGSATYTCSLPRIMEGSDFILTPEFTEKNIEIKAEENIKLNISDGKTFAFQKLKATPADSSNKLTELTITYISKDGKTKKTMTVNCKEQGNAEKGTFVVEGPDDMRFEDIGSVTVSAKLEEKAYALPTEKLEDGSLVPASKKADAGESVKIKIVPKQGYRAKYGTVKARIQYAKGGVQNIAMTRTGVNEYEFTLPYDEDGTNKFTQISFMADFEPGSDDIERSLGASLAASYIDADNNVEIESGSSVIAGRNLQMYAISDGGKAETVAKAGYSKGITGIAGAIALQMADVDTRSVIRKGATVSIGGNNQGGGSLNMLAKAAEAFSMTGNAMGRKKDDGTTEKGVGSGIVFAIDSITSQAEVEDGAIFVTDNNTILEQTKNGPVFFPRSILRNISIDANHKTKTTLDAVAGAAGGSSYVPVLAVEIFNSEATAKLGAVTPSGSELTTGGDVVIRAKS